jgi:hypothetical protein
MLGHIASFDQETGQATLVSQDKTYSFDLTQWQEKVPPDVGDEVIFEAVSSSALQVKLRGLHPELTAVKYKYLAVFLALILGWLGLHRFYLGYYRIGFMQLALSALLIYTGFIVFAPQWAFVDALLLFSGNIAKDAKGRPLK